MFAAHSDCFPAVRTKIWFPRTSVRRIRTVVPPIRTTDPNIRTVVLMIQKLV